MLRRLLTLWGLALGGMASAAAQPGIELMAAPAWAAWSRPGRASEIDIRVTAAAATRVTLELVAGRQTVRAELDLQPGRAIRLHLPVASAPTVTLSAGQPGAAPLRRELAVAQSESPLLGLALADGTATPAQGIEGFNSVALTADDLPRNASAYASIDALMLDAATLGALDQRQLDALLAHAAACGRVAVVSADDALRRLLQGAAGCGGRAMLHAASLAEARGLLVESLATILPATMSPATLGGVTEPDHAMWRRVAVALAVYFAAAAIVLLFFTSTVALVLAPALVAVAAVLFLHAAPPTSWIVVWGESESGAQVARYQGLQQFAGVARGTLRVPLPPQLASGARPCDATQTMQLDFDVAQAQAVLARFDSRLFGQTALCYAGSFPVSRALASQMHADGSREITNAAGSAWPAGLLLAAGQVHDLPALGPGERQRVVADAGVPPRDAVARMALARTAPGGVAALWALDLAGVPDLPAVARGWLLVSGAAP